MQTPTSLTSNSYVRASFSDDEAANSKRENIYVILRVCFPGFIYK